MPGLEQCRLRDRKVVADIRVELGGDVGHVEDVAKLLHLWLGLGLGVGVHVGVRARVRVSCFTAA